MSFVSHIANSMFMVLTLSALLADHASAQSANQEGSPTRWSIALHGGAGTIPRDLPQEQVEAMHESLRRALTAGKNILAGNGSAIDAVAAVVVVLEDDPRFNAGKGAVFTRTGTHELDAAIMDGATLKCGAVAGVKLQKNPIKAARLVMEKTPHVLLIGEGADQFAAANGGEQVTQEYFYTERRFRELQQALTKGGHQPLEKPAYSVRPSPEPSTESQRDESRGTVGCVALDMNGNLAAATSTGGLAGKMPGRIGDTPIIGAGTYADSRTCAVSCTGSGEEFIRHSIAAKVAWLVADGKHTVDQAVANCLGETLQPGDGGMIAIDRKGAISMQSSTGSMPRGAADSGGRYETAIWFER